MADVAGEAPGFGPGDSTGGSTDAEGLGFGDVPGFEAQAAATQAEAEVETGFTGLGVPDTPGTLAELESIEQAFAKAEEESEAWNNSFLGGLASFFGVTKQADIFDPGDVDTNLAVNPVALAAGFINPVLGSAVSRIPGLPTININLSELESPDMPGVDAEREAFGGVDLDPALDIPTIGGAGQPEPEVVAEQQLSSLDQFLADFEQLPFAELPQLPILDVLTPARAAHQAFRANRGLS